MFDANIAASFNTTEGALYTANAFLCGSWWTRRVHVVWIWKRTAPHLEEVEARDEVRDVGAERLERRVRLGCPQTWNLQRRGV